MRHLLPGLLALLLALPAASAFAAPGAPDWNRNPQQYQQDRQAPRDLRSAPEGPQRSREQPRAQADGTPDRRQRFQPPPRNAARNMPDMRRQAPPPRDAFRNGPGNPQRFQPPAPSRAVGVARVPPPPVGSTAYPGKRSLLALKLW